MNVFELVGTFAVKGLEKAKSDIKGASSTAKGEFGGLGDSAKKASAETVEGMQSAAKSTNPLVEGVKKVGLAVGAFLSVAAIKDFASACVDAAAEVSAESSSFEQIMGDYTVQAQAKMQEVADATGVVSTRLTGSMTSMTAKFKGLGYGVEDATGLAARGLAIASDAAAFWDKSLDDSMGSLNSFINGSYEGGEAIGLFANDTQMAQYAVQQGVVQSTKDWSALDEATKQATRLEYAENMMALSGATGQAAKESLQYANVKANLTERWRQFQAVIGEPIMQNVVIPAMAALTGLMEKVAPYAQAAAEGLGSLSSKAQEWFGGMGNLVSMASGPAEAVRLVIANLGTTVSQLANTVVPMLVERFANGLTMMAELLPQVLPAILEGLTSVIQTLATMAPQLIDQIVLAFTTALSTLSSMLPELLPSLIQAALGLFNGLVTALVQVVPQLLAALTAAVSQLAAMLPTRLPQIVQAALQLFSGIAQAVTQALPQIIQALTSTVPQLVQAIVSMLPQIVQAAVQLFIGIATAVAQALPQIIQALISILPSLVQSLISMLPQIVQAAVQLFVGIAEALPIILPQVVSAILGILPQLLSAIGSMMPAILAGAVQLFMALAQAVPQVLGALIGALGSLLSQLPGVVVGYMGQMTRAGYDLIMGIGQGISDAAGWVIGKINSLCSDALGAVKSFFGIASPSKVMRRMFDKDWGGGIVQGIGLAAKKVSKAMDEVNEAATPDIDPGDWAIGPKTTAVPAARNIVARPQQAARSETPSQGVTETMLVSAIRKALSSIDRGDVVVRLNEREVGRLVRSYA